VTTPGLFIELLSKDPAFYVSVLATLVFSITLHELGHAMAAVRQGDDTPRLLGRLTLDPMVQMGPASLIMAALLGMAWGVTPVNPANFRSRHGDAIVAFAGPLVNLALALISLTVLALLLRGKPEAELVAATTGRNNLHMFLLVFGSWNMILFVFNMLPIPPLDGATVLGDFVPAFGRLRFIPEAQPWFLAALIGAVVLLPIGEVAMRISGRYLALWL
jgi:Zn-dependent protease